MSDGIQKRVQDVGVDNLRAEGVKKALDANKIRLAHLQVVLSMPHVSELISSTAATRRSRGELAELGDTAGRRGGIGRRLGRVVRSCRHRDRLVTSVDRVAVGKEEHTFIGNRPTVRSLLRILHNSSAAAATAF